MSLINTYYKCILFCDIDVVLTNHQETLVTETDLFYVATQPIELIDVWMSPSCNPPRLGKPLEIKIISTESDKTWTKSDKDRSQTILKMKTEGMSLHP